MADRLTINRAPQRQVKKRTVRNCRRSGQFALPEDREAFRRIRGRVSPARKPFAIAQEFGDAKVQDPDHCEISGLAARSGEETSAGCGLAQSRTSDGRFLRRVESLTHEDTFQVPSTRKRPIDLRHRVLDGPGFHERVHARRQPRWCDCFARARVSMPGKVDQHSREARRHGIGHGGVDTAHLGC